MFNRNISEIDPQRANCIIILPPALSRQSGMWRLILGGRRGVRAARREVQVAQPHEVMKTADVHLLGAAGDIAGFGVAACRRCEKDGSRYDRDCWRWTASQGVQSCLHTAARSGRFLRTQIGKRQCHCAVVPLALDSVMTLFLHDSVSS